MRNLLATTTLALSLLPLVVLADTPFDYEATKAHYSTRDFVYEPLPAQGYGFYKIAENAWFVYDDFENMVFFETDDGVVVVDPKPDVSPFVLDVIPQVTDKPITHVVYSHHHRDHSQGAHLFPEEAILIASKETADLLALAGDPKRPMPDVVFDTDYVLETGGLRLEMHDLERNWHSQSDMLIWAPEQKILWAIDMFHPDAAPWIHFGESTDPWFAFGLPDRLLAEYDFNFVITGHERIVGTPEHMELYSSFIKDMKQTIGGIVQSDWYHTEMAEVATRYDESAAHYIYKAGIMTASNACAEQMIEKWDGTLRNAPLNMVENCQTMFMHQIVLDP
ncbi:MBL fold metallo-hydrolase [Tropicimonas sp. TH_r6]|uniref:MBL fold metallo-hydrolase n=1 Tax=Tropicimonas sp. TH_r6 TaxID=3082085 RepID=UPI0029533EAE|nr:MBL fold metallo-hydrolase [Tropicimonas sp. TH_r6]MDV7141565.1 MBL fold metallo-hydrolase [Tropicimonas sp. TH_r6]